MTNIPFSLTKTSLRSAGATAVDTLATRTVVHAAVAAVAALAVVLAAVFPAVSYAQPSSSGMRVYLAELRPMNSEAAGHETMGEARFKIEGDRLTIDIDVKEAAPDIAHWQHFHGFKDGRDARCPTEAADANNDGVVDLPETEMASGTTMVPFDENPIAMDVARGTYPKAAASGSYTYSKTVSLRALDAAVGKAFDGAKADLTQRVVFIHGVAPETKLPDSVASLGAIPAQVTLPIACGKVREVEQ